MAAEELVEFTTGFAESEDMVVASGSKHTLYPITKGKPGKVVVWAKLADDSYTILSPSINLPKQIDGPFEYKVQVRNAGCDVDTGE